MKRTFIFYTIECIKLWCTIFKSLSVWIHFWCVFMLSPHFCKHNSQCSMLVCLVTAMIMILCSEWLCSLIRPVQLDRSFIHAGIPSLTDSLCVGSRNQHIYGSCTVLLGRGAAVPLSVREPAQFTGLCCFRFLLLMWASFSILFVLDVPTWDMYLV